MADDTSRRTAATTSSWATTALSLTCSDNLLGTGLTYTAATTSRGPRSVTASTRRRRQRHDPAPAPERHRHRRHGQRHASTRGPTTTWCSATTARSRGDIDAGLLPLNSRIRPCTRSPTRRSSRRTPDGGGNDLIYGDEVAEAATDGDDIVIAGQGADTAFGGGADDDLIGGHNVAGGHDAGDDLDGGSGVDVIAGDNAASCGPARPLSDQFRTLSGPTMYDSAGARWSRPTPGPTRPGPASGSSARSTTRPPRPRARPATTTSPAAPRTTASSANSATT